MRVLEGKYQRQALKSIHSPEVRPTARRLREVLFQLLAPHLRGARFLDLCAGSGAVGIEALSRGAAHATFVERSTETCRLIESNLRACGVWKEQSEVLAADVQDFLAPFGAGESGAWDIAFFDPPYATNYAPVLARFASGAALRRGRGGVLVIEHHFTNRLHDQTGVLRRWRVVRAGESCLSLYERKR